MYQALFTPPRVDHLPESVQRPSLRLHEPGLGEISADPGQFLFCSVVICDYRGIFIDVEIMWPGSVHDARVYANSQLNKHFTEKTLPMTYRSLLPCTDRIPPLILGDPAYPLLPKCYEGIWRRCI